MMRKWTKIFLLIFIVEIIVFAILILSIYFNISGLEEQIKTISYVLGALATSLITTALVYHNFSQEPELGLTGFHISPKPNIVVKQGDSRKFPVGVKIIECDKPPEYLLVQNAITNLGLGEIEVHACQVEQTYPDTKKFKPKPWEKRRNGNLIYQARDSIDVKFPSDVYESEPQLKELIREEGGLYRLKFNIVCATIKYRKQVWINISEDMKTIEWSESKFKKLIRWTKTKDKRKR